MGKSQRDKGRRGQREAKELLADRDWVAVELNAGTSVSDFWANDPHGKTWSVEVKNAVSMNIRAWRKQAREQAGNLPWILLCKIDGTGSWLVLRQGKLPVVWHNKNSRQNDLPQ